MNGFVSGLMEANYTTEPYTTGLNFRNRMEEIMTVMVQLN